MTGGGRTRNAGLRRIVYYYLVALGCAEALGGLIMLEVGGDAWSLLLVGSRFLIAGMGLWLIRKWKTNVPTDFN